MKTGTAGYLNLLLTILWLFGLNYLFMKAGFSNIVVTPTAGYFTTMALRFNYFSRRLIRGPFIIKKIISFMLIPFWYISQGLAPSFDKLDKRWVNEAPGFFVTASKNDH